MKGQTGTYHYAEFICQCIDSCVLQQLLSVALLYRFTLSFESVAALAGEVFASVEVLEKAAHGIEVVVSEFDLASLAGLSKAVG